jgi:LysM repeat protein
MIPGNCEIWHEDLSALFSQGARPAIRESATTMTRTNNRQKRVGTLRTLAAILLCCSSAASGQTLLGSRATMERQNEAAVNYGYSFMQTSGEVMKHVEQGYLVKVAPNRYMDLHNVSFPYARSQVKLFIDRLSTQYHGNCGEKLTVTSLTRPINKQPANASQASVHPTGMAVDLRIPPRGNCRSWLESTLLSLEKTGVLDVTRERNPPHYHVAVFTEDYASYVAGVDSGNQSQGRPASEYTVRRGDSLSVIATRTNTTIQALRSANGLRGDMIRAGQKLQIPGTSPAATQSVQQVAAAAEPAVPRQVAAVSEVTHQVRRGETLWRIASRYGTSVNRIRSENGLANDLLQVGQVLRLSQVSNTP